MLELITKGGVLMIPIVGCSVLALAIVIERFINLSEAKIHPPEFVGRLKQLLLQRKVNDAIAICSNTASSIAHVIEVGILKRHQERQQIKEAIEQTGKEEASLLHKNMGTLSTIATISPLLGLLGTVTGMIKVFRVISVEGVGNPWALAGGISEALITTAAGLIVAIPSLIAYNYLYKRANRLVLKMENTSLELLEILVENTRSNTGGQTADAGSHISKSKRR